MPRLSPEKVAELQTIIELVADRLRDNFEVSAARVEQVYSRHLLHITDPQAAAAFEQSEIRVIGPGAAS